MNSRLIELREYEVEVPSIYQTGSPKKLYLGHCYRKAYEYLYGLRRIRKIADESEIRLVHGAIVFLPHTIFHSHAWVEIGEDIVFDGVLQRFYSKNDYYRVEEAIKIADYSLTAALRISGKHRHFGFWYPEEVHTVFRSKKGISIIGESNGYYAVTCQRYEELMDVIDFPDESLTPLWKEGSTIPNQWFG